MGSNQGKWKYTHDVLRAPPTVQLRYYKRVRQVFKFVEEAGGVTNMLNVGVIRKPDSLRWIFKGF